MNQRIHRSLFWNPPTQHKSSQLFSSSFSVKAQNSSKHSTQENEKEACGQDNFEADRLQLRAESGTITSAEQEQLNLLQAKMNDFWVQKRETASQFGHNMADISVSSPDKQSSIIQSNKYPVRAKLTIGEPGDKYEREADSVAAKVVTQINSPQPQQQQAVRRMEALKEEEELQTKPEITSLQRIEAPEEEELEDLQTKSILQGKEATGEEASTVLESAINSARSGGQSLDGGLQESMGQAMGADFSGVKVHTDSTSNQLNQSIQARAFTTGQDVFFRQGEYNPGSRGGQELIAHELTHVVQQSGGAVQTAETDTNIHTMRESGVVQRLSAEYYDRASIVYGRRAFAHMTQDQLETYLRQYHNEIVVGEQQSIRVGEGRTSGYAVRGQIIYNCEYNENAQQHIIRVTHAHDRGRMG